jgi:hypothetical protein
LRGIGEGIAQRQRRGIGNANAARRDLIQLRLGKLKRLSGIAVPAKANSPTREQ